MGNIQLRESLLAKADAAFLQLVVQIDYLLDASQFYIDRYPPVDRSSGLKLEQLNVAIVDLGALPKQLAIEIERWKKGQERVLSPLGVETQVLNELYATIEAAMLFFIREDIDLSRFTLSLVKQYHAELLRCNRLL